MNESGFDFEEFLKAGMNTPLLIQEDVLRLRIENKGLKEALEDYKQQNQNLKEALEEQKQYTAFKCDENKKRTEELEAQIEQMKRLLEKWYKQHSDKTYTKIFYDELIKATEAFLWSDVDEYITPTFVEYVQKLEKENAELKGLRCCENCKNVNLQLHWRESEEIDKRRQFVCGTCGNHKHWEYLGKTVGITETQQLTKAKEIIKKFSEFANNEIEYDPEHPQEHTDLWNKLCEQAEQFLKEIEK